MTPEFCRGFGGDLKTAWRRLVGAPMFTIFAIASLALGVGVTATVYSVVDRVFWRDLGIRQADGLVMVTSPEAGAFRAQRVLSAPDFEDLRQVQTCFADLSASALIYPTVSTPSTTEIHPGEAVDGRYFALLGVNAAIGRVIRLADDTMGTPVVVISHGLWRSRFASRLDIVGRTLRLSGRPFEIIGVAPKSYDGLPGGDPIGTRLWVPLGAAGALLSGGPSSSAPERERRRLGVVGRLKAGRTVQHATTELAAIGAGLDSAYPRPKTAKPRAEARRGWSARDVSELDAAADPAAVKRRFGVLVVGLVALVLVVACTNLANLVIVRGTMRHHEFAVRCALGAPRWRLVREQLAESLALAIGGGVLSVWVMAFLTWALDVELPLAPGFLASVRPEVDTNALLVAAGALLLSLVVFGLEPALQLTARMGVREDLEGTGSVGMPRARRQRALLRWQVAISTGFLIIASLCVRYLVTEGRHASGVDMGRLGVMSIDFSVQQRDEEGARRVLERLIRLAGREPGIEAVAVSTGFPFGTLTSPRLKMALGDAAFAGEGNLEDAVLIEATPGFFRTAGISILRGRPFDSRDEAGGPPVMILSESSAKRLFGTADVVGRQLRVEVDNKGLPPPQPLETAMVVGVAEDTDTTHLFQRRGSTAYMPFAQKYFPLVTVAARASDAAVAIRALENAARKADPAVPLSIKPASGRATLAGMHLFLRGIGTASLVLGAITLLLAMTVLDGVQSYIVAHRTREIGIRMSLGARAEQIRFMVLADGCCPVLQGIAIGLFIGTASRVIVQTAVGIPIGIIDPWTLVIVPLPLLLAALLGARPPRAPPHWVSTPASHCATCSTVEYALSRPAPKSAG